MWYHVSTKWKETFDELKPFVPSYLSSSLITESNIKEEKETARICVSNDIGKCLLALGDIHFYFDMMESDPIVNYEEGLMDAFTNEWGVPVRIYTIEEEPCVSNEDIVQNELVYDAMNTYESWFLKSIKPTSSRLFLVTAFKTKHVGHVEYEGYYFDDERQMVEVMYFESFKEKHEGKTIDEILELYIEDRKTWFDYAPSEKEEVIVHHYTNITSNNSNPFENLISEKNSF